MKVNPFTGQILAMTVVEAETPDPRDLIPNTLAAQEKRGEKYTKPTIAVGTKVPAAMLFIKWEEKDDSGKFVKWTKPDWNELHVEYYAQNVHSGWYLEDDDDEDEEDVQYLTTLLELNEELHIHSILKDFLCPKKAL